VISELRDEIDNERKARAIVEEEISQMRQKHATKEVEQCRL